MEDRPTTAHAPAVVVVASDGERLEQYRSAFQAAEIQARATLDADEAASLVADLSPRVLVLDRGLPRLALFRLYGLVREETAEVPAQIVFVGQEGDTGSDDHYLAGETAPSAVVERVARLVATDASGAATVRPADHAPRESAAAPSDETIALSSQPSQAGDDARSAPASAATAPAATTAAASSSAAPATADDAAADAASTDAPGRSGRRLDVILIRVGLALLILGALLMLIQSAAFPTSVTAPPAPTRRPTVTPKPGAVLPPSGAQVSAAVGLG
jgi:hypothetical protein